MYPSGVAQAKPFSIESVSLRGPGLQEFRTITMDDRNWDRGLLVAFSLVARPRYERVRPPPALGPKFTVVSEFRATDFIPIRKRNRGSIPDPITRVKQAFYPYAAGGPLVHNPSDPSEIRPERGNRGWPLNAGWFRIPQEAVSAWEETGLHPPVPDIWRSIRSSLVSAVRSIFVYR